MSSPTPTKDTIRSIDPTLDRSMKKSFNITAASNPDPANHTDRSSLRRCLPERAEWHGTGENRYFWRVSVNTPR